MVKVFSSSSFLQGEIRGKVMSHRANKLQLPFLDVERSQGGEADSDHFRVLLSRQPAQTLCFVYVYKRVVEASNLEVHFSNNVIFKMLSNISRAGSSLDR